MPDEPLRSTLADWLAWQESLNPAEIELGLDRVLAVAGQLRLPRPAHGIYTVAGTNGKGSCVAALEALLSAAGLRCGVYTSPHLVRYNERIRVARVEATDAAIVAAFERVDRARGELPLTYFEFGTLAAVDLFAAADCDCWILEVGLGGRLDAVNAFDPDVALITTVDLDHQAWLGDDIETIAAEKAGIFRRGVPALYGGEAVPRSVQQRAAELGVPVLSPGHGYRARAGAAEWRWQGRLTVLDNLTVPPGGAVQIANQALALAAVEALEPQHLQLLREQPGLLAGSLPPGRAQRYRDTHDWLLDVAHNPQAARALRESFSVQVPATVVLGMLADKHAAAFVAELGLPDARWITVPSTGFRGSSADGLAQRLQGVVAAAPVACASVADGLAAARRLTPAGDLILVCGSFSVVGPALQQLGLY